MLGTELKPGTELMRAMPGDRAETGDRAHAGDAGGQSWNRGQSSCRRCRGTELDASNTGKKGRPWWGGLKCSEFCGIGPASSAPW